MRACVEKQRECKDGIEKLGGRRGKRRMRVILTRNNIRMGGGGGECKQLLPKGFTDMFNDVSFYVVFHLKNFCRVKRGLSCTLRLKCWSVKNTRNKRRSKVRVSDLVLLK